MTAPIIFVPGTSGIALTTPTQFSYTFPGDTHPFPDGTLTHEPRDFQYSEASSIWIGPETVSAFLNDTFSVTDTLTLNVNRGNHYLDVLRFGSNGYQDPGSPFPLISAGDVLAEVDTGIGVNVFGIQLDMWRSWMGRGVLLDRSVKKSETSSIRDDIDERSLA